MTLDKGILHGKEHRKPYRRSQAFDRSCRCHGGCSYCYAARMYAHRKREAAAAAALAAYRSDVNEQKPTQ
jgi:DNA repair photolyase